MAIKPFAIQGSDLTLGGVNLSAGATTIVIPGVTQATNYRAEEVERLNTIGGNNPDIFGSDEGAVTVIDNAEYLYLVDDGDTPSANYVAATYSVDELDDGRIEEVNIESGGTFAAADKTRVEAADMWATTTPTPFVSFNTANWTQIPYRPKMRAGEIENIGGGNANTGNFTFSNDTISNDNGLLLDTNRGSLAIGTNMEGIGVAGHFHIAFNGSNNNPPVNDLFLGDDYNYVKLPGSELNPETQYGVEIGTEQRSGPQNVVVDAVDELVPPGGVWRLFIIIEDYPNLGSAVSIGDTVTTSWGTPITATITGVVEAVGDGDWQIQVAQDITAGFSAGPKQVSFGSSGLSHTWRFGTDGELILPNGSSIESTAGDGIGLTTDRGTILFGNSPECVPTAQTHFHIMKQDAVNVELFLGDDSNYVKLPGTQANAYGVEIGTNSGEGANTWRFGTDGSITFPDNTVQTTAYTGQTGGGGVTVSDVWVQTFVTDQAIDIVQAAVSVEYDAAGNLIALFNHVSTVDDSTYYSVGKYTTTGTRLWTVRFADDFNTDGWGLAVDQSNGYIYIAGKTNSDGGQPNATLTKISGTDGTIAWSKQYDFGYNSTSPVVDVATGDPVMVGYAFNSEDEYVTTTKIDSTDGSVMWSRALDGQGNEAAYGMAVGPAGEVVAVGYMAQLGEGADTDDHIVVVKYNSAGAIQWQKAILFDAGYDSAGADADIDSEGNVYVCAQYEPVGGGEFFLNQQMSIVKFNSSGVKQWSRRINGNCDGVASSIVVGPDDKLYLSATTFSGDNPNNIDIHLVLAKYEFDGTVAWQRLLDYTDGISGSIFALGFGGGSSLAVKQDYVAVGLAFSDTFFGNPSEIHAAIAQVSTAGDLFTVGSWDFKQASFSGLLSSDASDITVVNAGKTDTDNASTIDTVTVALGRDSSNFLVGTLYSAAIADDTVGFTILADGSLQANTSGSETVLTSTLQNGRPDWLMITPRGPDRDGLDTDYGFNGTGMWFTGDTEATASDAPSYPIHTRDAIPADAKVVVEFDISLVSGQEDWSICVYPANGVPHWAWNPHPSRIAAIIDCSDDPVVAQAEIHGFNSENYGVDVSSSDIDRARFTYDPLAELTTLELLDADGAVTSRAQLPGRLARNQDYMIGFDADWDEAGPGDKSYFTNLTITTSASATKTTELTVSGEIKLPNTVKGFVNMQGPWSNNEDDITFQSVTTHDGFAYMIGESSWNDSNRVRIDKYSLTSGELVWTRVLGAGRDAQFDISWTGGVYTLNSFSNGQDYKVGELLQIPGWIFSGDGVLNRVTITVTAVGSNGGIEAATISGTAPSGTDSVTGVENFYSDANGHPNSIKYDTISDTLVILTEQNALVGDADDDTWTRAVVVRINPVSGDVVSSVTLADEGDIYPYDVAVHPTTGATAVVGQKFNEYRQLGALTMLAKGLGYFDILKSNLDEEHWPGNQLPGEYAGDFWISGTGIASKENVNNVNYYGALSGTTRQGSGAEFAISDDGFGNYTLFGVNAGGTNYLPGHKIKILGTSIGGATPDNDAIITVTTVSSGAITAGTISGTPGTTGLWTNVSGTNYQVGSGMTLDINVDTLTGSRIAFVINQGSNYVTNDVVVISGTQFANGATPTNDVEVTIVNVGGSGNVTDAVTAGLTPTNAIRIGVNGVDFTAVGGSWTMKQNLGGEASVWTPNWDKAIGGPSYDRFQSVIYSKDGASIYAVGDGRYEVDYTQSLVVKFATSDGTIGFSKYLNSDTENSYATGVATIGTSDIVVSGWEYNTIDPINRNQQFVARMNSSGTVIWKKFYSDGNWESGVDSNSDIQVDSDDNIYVTIQLAPDVFDWNSQGFTVTKLDKDGNLLWTRCVNGNESSYLGNYNGTRWSSLHNDQLVVVGYTYETADDYYSGLWASVPTDGFAYLGGEGDFVQMGAFRLSQGRISDGVRTLLVGNTFTPSNQAPTITATTDLKNYATRDPASQLPQHLHKIVDPKHGGLVFGDGTRQTTAADRIPQIKADNAYWITANDSGKHVYYKNNSGTVYIPGWWKTNLPVGFTFTIVNRTGNDCYVQLEGSGPNERGTILGAGRNLNYHTWGIPDSGSGSMVTLILLEAGHDYNNGGNQDGPVWMISGPGDIYIDD